MEQSIDYKGVRLTVHGRVVKDLFVTEQIFYKDDKGHFSNIYQLLLKLNIHDIIEIEQILTNNFLQNK